jgi:hypothetical protein
MVQVNDLLQRYKFPIIIVATILLGYLFYWIYIKYLKKSSPEQTNSKVLFSDSLVPLKNNNIKDVITDNILMEMKKEDVIKLKSRNQLTVFTYIKLSNMDTNYGSKKNILFKSATPNINGDDPSFQLSIRETVNDVEFRIKVHSGNNFYYDSVYVTDIPIAVWTSVAFVVDGNQINVYKNGKFYRSKVLSGQTKFVNTPLLVGKGQTKDYMDITKFNSLDGYIAGLYYSYVAESESFINTLHNTALSRQALKKTILTGISSAVAAECKKYEENKK